MKNIHVFSILAQVRISPPDKPEIAPEYEGLPVD